MSRSRAGWRKSSDGAAHDGDCAELTAWRKSSYSNANGGACVEVAAWRKSSYSNANGGQCVEVAAWRKSSHSAANGGDCVEVAGSAPRGVAVRDSKDPGGPALTFTPSAWQSFAAGLRNGEFTLR